MHRKMKFGKIDIKWLSQNYGVIYGDLNMFMFFICNFCFLLKHNEHILFLYGKNFKLEMGNILILISI